MRVPESILRNVAFVVVGDEPRATAFFVGIPEVEERIMVPYVVTARHAVEATAGQPFLIRINSDSGRFHEEATTMNDWWTHDTEDVAAIRFERGSSSPGYNIQLTTPSQFIAPDYHFEVVPVMQDLAKQPGFAGGLSGRWTEKGFEDMLRAPIQVGDELFFVSLLYEQPGEERNLPIVRFGHISRMPEEPIVMPGPGETLVRLTAYLAECHSWGGHSGSPVFWTHPMTMMRELPDPDDETKSVYLPQEVPLVALLGLVSAHWDIKQKAETEGDIIGTIRTAINSGIAVVTPAAAIHDLLMREDVVKDRKKIAKERREELDKRRAMTPDTATEDEPFTRDEFYADLTKVTRRVDEEPEKERS